MRSTAERQNLRENAGGGDSWIFTGDCLFYPGFDRLGRGIFAYTGAHGCHDVPVVEIDQDTLDIGPLSAHLGFYRMDRTCLVPEYAVAIVLLSQNRPPPRHTAKLLDKPMRVDTNIARNSPDIPVGNKGTPITDTALSTLRTGKRRSICILFHIFIIGHAVSPWLAAGLPDPRT